MRRISIFKRLRFMLGQAYEAKRWAFVSDYVRLWAVYHYGGIYLDTDVEVARFWNPLLEYRAFLDLRI